MNPTNETTASSESAATVGKKVESVLPQDSDKWKVGQGTIFNKPPIKRKNKLGEYDVMTPEKLMTRNQINGVAVITTAENRHPEEQQLIEHYARQQAAKLAGTYNPLEDPPVFLEDLLPRCVFVVNKVFTEQEILLGGQAAIDKYIEELKEFIDLDIISLPMGKPLIAPLHPKIPREHRDKIYNAQMQSYYKNLDGGAEDLMKRVVAAQAEAKAKREEVEKENARKALEAAEAKKKKEIEASSST
jgi:hypothetical protein